MSTPESIVTRRLLQVAGKTGELSRQELPLDAPWISGDYAGIFGLSADGNPIRLAERLTTNAVAGPTPAQIGTTTARLLRFQLPRHISVSYLRLLGVAATTNEYRVAIYHAGTGAIVRDMGLFSTAAATWTTITFVTPIELDPLTPYWFAICGASAGATAGLHSPPAPPAGMWATAGPLSGKTIGLPQQAQVTLAVASTFPAALPVLAIPSWAGTANGSIPFAWVEGTPR